MNTDLHFSSKTNEWATPQAFFDNLNKEFKFTLDPSSTKENAKCKKFYTEADNGLVKSWDNEIVFCNPPYGRGLKDWVKKASEARGGSLYSLYRLGQIQRTFTTTSITKQRFDSCEDVSSSETARTLHLSLLC